MIGKAIYLSHMFTAKWLLNLANTKQLNLWKKIVLCIKGEYFTPTSEQEKRDSSDCGKTFGWSAGKLYPYMLLFLFPDQSVLNFVPCGVL